MTPEQIVRALAAADPLFCDLGEDVCTLCSAERPTEAEQHESACPWRLAVEWVARAVERKAGIA